MTTFIANDVELPFINEPMDMLNIVEFIAKFKYYIDQLYIDKFWNSIENKSWIVVDYAMLRWMGYECKRDIDNKLQYIKLLKYNFTEGKDYDRISIVDNRISSIDYTNKKLAKNTIIVTSDAFYKSTLLMQTTKANTIKMYNLRVKEIKIDYLKYTNYVNNR